MHKVSLSSFGAFPSLDNRVSRKRLPIETDENQSVGVDLTAKSFVSSWVNLLESCHVTQKENRKAKGCVILLNMS